MSPIEVLFLLAASPVVAYLVMKFGAYGYFRAKQLAKRKEVEPTNKE